MAPQALLVSDVEYSRRSSERQSINQPSTLRDNMLTACDVYVRDISETGFAVATDANLALGGIVSLGLPGHGRAEARVVRPIAGGYGCEFVDALPDSAFTEMFRGGTVVRLTSSVPFSAPLPEPDITPWPLPVRGWLIVGGSLTLWAAVIGIVIRLI